MNINVAIDLLLSLIARTQQVSQLITTARNSGRESLNAAEVDALSREVEAASADLQAAIDKAESEGR